MSTTEDRPWSDPDLEPAERARLVLERMTLEEKVGQLDMSANIDPVADAERLRAGSVGTSILASGPWAGNVGDGGVRARGIRALQREAVARHRLGVPLLIARDVIHGHRTVMPIPLGGAASFRPDLVEDALRRVHEEAITDEISWSFTPMMDVAEDPRWGRVAESFGEDPHLVEVMAAAAVRGVQTAGAKENGRPRVAACMKHFVAYGLARGGRDYNSVDVGETTLRNVHLRPFRAAVDAGCLTAMASFNDVDGVPMHANGRLLREVLRDEWGFTGVVTADWCGIGELVEHGVAADRREAARMGIEAGVDVDMVSGVYVEHLVDLVESGDIDKSLVDEAVLRVLTLKFTLGLFDRDFSDEAAPATVWERPRDESALDVARTAARSSVTLLTNDGILPLSRTCSVHVTGPFAVERESLLGTWCLDGRPDETTTVVEALTASHDGEVTWDDGRFADHAARLVTHADTALVLLGEHRSSSGEANSLSRLEVPAGQIEFLRQVRIHHDRVVAVVLSGRPLVLEEVAELSDAVLLVFHGGTETARALVDVLHGVVEPGGRLPTTLPPSTGHVPLTVREKRTSRPLSPYRTEGWDRRYVDAPTPATWPFGFGLGYADARLGVPRLSGECVGRGDSVEVAVSVSSGVSRAGRALVQLYLCDPAAQITRPWRELLDWQWVEVPAQGATEVHFTVSVSSFGYWGRDGRRRVDTGRVDLGVGLDSRDIAWTRLEVNEGA